MSEYPEALPLDKSKWGPGPWQTEPDRIEFEYLGFPCLITRTHMGNLCGYVAVGPDHPWHKLGYTDCTKKRKCKAARESHYCAHTPESLIRVHGGLTYSNQCAGHICHVPKPGQPDNVKWFGFDCAHGGDGMPGISAHLMNEDNFFSKGYKDIPYVKREIERMAAQLKAYA